INAQTNHMVCNSILARGKPTSPGRRSRISVRSSPVFRAVSSPEEQLLPEWEAVMEGDLPFSHLAAAAQSLRRRKISSVELTELMLERIGRLNPRLGAMTAGIAESARREAQHGD